MGWLEDRDTVSEDSRFQQQHQQYETNVTPKQHWSQDPHAHQELQATPRQYMSHSAASSYQQHQRQKPLSVVEQLTSQQLSYQQARNMHPNSGGGAPHLSIVDPHGMSRPSPPSFPAQVSPEGWSGSGQRTSPLGTQRGQEDESTYSRTPDRLRRQQLQQHQEWEDRQMADMHQMQSPHVQDPFSQTLRFAHQQQHQSPYGAGGMGHSAPPPQRNMMPPPHYQHQQPFNPRGGHNAHAHGRYGGGGGRGGGPNSGNYHPVQPSGPERYSNVNSAPFSSGNQVDREVVYLVSMQSSCCNIGCIFHPCFVLYCRCN